MAPTAFLVQKKETALKVRVALPTPSMHLAFPLANGINLRVNSSSDNLNDYISGTLTVDMNPDRNVSNAVLMADARFSNQQLFKASSVCLTNFFNTSEIVVHVCVACSSTVLCDESLLYP
jgi:hypothetical protein